MSTNDLAVTVDAAVWFVAGLLVRGRGNSVLRSVRKRRRDAYASPSSSLSLLKNTSCYLFTKEELAEFVNALRNLANVLPLTMTISPALSGGYFVSCATSESSVLVLRAYLSQQLLTSLSRPEWRYWENELQLVDHRRSGLAAVNREQ